MTGFRYSSYHKTKSETIKIPFSPFSYDGIVQKEGYLKPGYQNNSWSLVRLRHPVLLTLILNMSSLICEWNTGYRYLLTHAQPLFWLFLDQINTYLRDSGSGSSVLYIGRHDIFSVWIDLAHKFHFVSINMLVAQSSWTLWPHVL